MMSPNVRPFQNAMNSLKRPALCAALGLALAGCGGDPGTVVTPQSSYTTTAPYTDSYYTNPGGNSGSTEYYGSYPGITDSLPVTGETTPEVSPTTPVGSGVDVQMLSKETPGMFSWERCEVQLTVKNHEATPQQGFLIASFTLKGREVELQYRALSLSAKGSQTFLLKSTVRADDVRLEYRTKLL